MIRFSSLVAFTVLSITSIQANAGTPDYTIQDVTNEYAKKAPALLYGDLTESSVAPAPTPGPLGNIDINKVIAIGEKVWDFVINNKPSSTIAPLKASIVPAGITSFTQLLWKKDNIASKIYRIEFKNAFGAPAGAFDYRITYMYGGTYQGKGKFLGQISVYPLNVNLRTDRSVNFKAELTAALNYGTEDDPIAGGQIVLSWTSPTTTRLEIKTREYMIYGDGDIQDFTNGI